MLSLDPSLLGQHGLIDPQSILKDYETNVLDVTLPKDEKIYVKLKVQARPTMINPLSMFN